MVSALVSHTEDHWFRSGWSLTKHLDVKNGYLAPAKADKEKVVRCSADYMEVKENMATEPYF